MSTRMVFDEVDWYFQREPTVAESIAHITHFAGAMNRRQSRTSPNMFWYGVEAPSEAEALKELERRKRKKAMENCQHGRLPFPIRWGPDVRR